MKTGLVLSGGGGRGIAHLGAIKALLELGIKPDMIAGASAGAIAGAFYAAGFSVEKMLDIVLEQKIFHFPGFSWHKDGLLNTRAVVNTCRMYLDDISFEKLNLPFYAAATNLNTAETEYFSTGDVATAIAASSAVPGIFEPVELNGNLYADGGILNNFPIEPLIGKCDILIGIHVNPLGTMKKDLDVPAILDRSFHMAIRSRALEKSAQCNLFIEPPGLANYGLFEFKQAQEIFDIAYQHTMGMADKIKAIKF